MGAKLTLAVLALPLLAGASLSAKVLADKGDGDKIRGSWAVVAGEKAGQKAPDDVLKQGRMTFADGMITWKMGEHESRGSYTLDSGKTPGQIDLTMGSKTLAGIYRLSGDDLKICMSAGDARPAEFATAADTKTVLLVLKRAAP